MLLLLQLQELISQLLQEKFEQQVRLVIYVSEDLYVIVLMQLCVLIQLVCLKFELICVIVCLQVECKMEKVLDSELVIVCVVLQVKMLELVSDYQEIVVKFVMFLMDELGEKLMMLLKDQIYFQFNK